MRRRAKCGAPEAGAATDAMRRTLGLAMSAGEEQRRGALECWRSAGGWSAGVLAGRSAGRLASWSADGPELLRLSARAGDATAAKCAMAWLLAAQSDVRRTTRGRC